MKKTLIVDIYGGPGSGKSTTRAGVFHNIKMNYQNIDIEEVTEFAKLLTWEERKRALVCQPFIFGNQALHIEMLVGKVDVIITDSPLLMSVIYAPKEYQYQYEQFVQKYIEQFNMLSFFLRRVKKYNPVGRNQTQKEAEELDKQIFNLSIPNLKFTYGNQDAVDVITKAILDRI